QQFFPLQECCTRDMPAPFSAHVLAGKLPFAAGVDNRDFAVPQSSLERVDFFQAIGLKVWLKRDGFDARRGGIGGPVFSHPAFPATVKNCGVLHAEILEGPPDASRVGQRAVIHNDRRIGTDAKLPHFLSPRLLIVEAALSAAQLLPTSD